MGESSSPRVILHVDMDAFFASVEVLDNPALAGQPVIVGGSGARGVVAACTYEARMFGVSSAMPSSMARRLCPQAIFLPGRYHRYVEESIKLHRILAEVTPLVEGISLDEAFCDVTGSERRLGGGPQVAGHIRDRVLGELRLACSVGVGRSKLISKLASKAAKPVADRMGVRPGLGVMIVDPDEEQSFLHPLPIRALWGIGPATATLLDGLGVRTIGELAQLPTRTLERKLGKAQGARLAALARGSDSRAVVPEHQTKSIGREETFPVDLWDVVVLRRHLARMADLSAAHLREAGLGARTITVKVRFGDFTTVTRSHSIASPVDSAVSVRALAEALLYSVDLTKGVRLLGISASGLAPAAAGTQLLFDLGGSVAGGRAGPGAIGPPGGFGTGRAIGGPDAAERLAAAGQQAVFLQRSGEGITTAIDEIRARFGKSSVGPASSVGPSGLAVRGRGDAQWGPSVSDSP